MQYGTVRLVPTDPRWTTIAAKLSADIRSAVGDIARAVEHIGSTAVPGLLAKPIVDLALGVKVGTAVNDLTEPMAQLGWIFRSDAGDDGGWVFVMEDAPWHRVAHAHGVEYDSRQWVRYMEFRDLLRSNAVARRAYERAKQQLAAQHPGGRADYTLGKDPTVQRLLADWLDTR